MVVIGGALFLMVGVARQRPGQPVLSVSGRTVLFAIAVIIVVDYGIPTLTQKSTCERQGGSFSFALPNACAYPAGSPYAHG